MLMKHFSNRYLRSTNGLPVRGKVLETPIYFPSISSLKTGSIDTIDYFQILKNLYPYFLISAYDIYNSDSRPKLIKQLQKNFKEDGPIVLLDSGNYESFWLQDKSWTVARFEQILSAEVCDLAFCFDNQFPKGVAENVDWIRKSVTRSQKKTKTASVIPIVHASDKLLSKTVTQLYAKHNFVIVSVAERNLGAGLFERVKTITNLRKDLNSLGYYVFIHVLGTGNPLSLLLLSYAGADSFDGLEWCQTVVNSKTCLLYHFQQRELVNDNCEFCSSNSLDYSLATFGHNLKFYNFWMTKIRQSIASNTQLDVLNEYFSPDIVNTLKNIWA